MTTNSLARALQSVLSCIEKDKLAEAKAQLWVLSVVLTSEPEDPEPMDLPNSALLSRSPNRQPSIVELDGPPELHQTNFDSLDGLVMRASMSGDLD